jgi:8-oxo-dGTP pyrophosphatase MutT (NUDIX family)
MADQFEVVVTAFIFQEDKLLLTRRSPNKKRFPGLWTVPGGHLEKSDFQNRSKDGVYWYDVLEIALQREVREEVGLEINNIRVVENLATIDPSGAVLVLSCTANYVSGNVTLQQDETDAFGWVERNEVKNYDLISGLPEEIERAFERRVSNAAN